MADPALPYTSARSGFVLRVRLSPKASRAGPTSLFNRPDGTALKISVTAPAQDGKANAALVKVLAKGLGVAKSAIAITTGHKDRNKVITVAGRSADIARRLDAWLTKEGIG